MADFFSILYSYQMNILISFQVVLTAHASSHIIVELEVSNRSLEALSIGSPLSVIHFPNYDTTKGNLKKIVLHGNMYAVLNVLQKDLFKNIVILFGIKALDDPLNDDIYCYHKTHVDITSAYIFFDDDPVLGLEWGFF